MGSQLDFFDALEDQLAKIINDKIRILLIRCNL